MMSLSYTTVKKQSKFTLEDRKSVFIAHCAPAQTEDAAIDFINQVKRAYPDAKHHVYAYSVRENNITRFSDDREPAGTAGMPVLDVIRKNNIQNTVIVVVRYFGGILLGTGGLVHAYGQSALGALKEAEIITYNTYTRLAVICDYSDYQRLLAIFSEYELMINDTEYTSDVRVSGSVLSSRADEFVAKVKNATSAKAEVELFEEIFDYRK